MALLEKCLTKCKKQIGRCLEDSPAYWTLVPRHIPKALRRDTKLLGHAPQR